jgi:hypothetical protein
MADGVQPARPLKNRRGAGPKGGKPENLTNAGKGRPKGVPNKTTALLKDAILKAAERAGNKLGDDGMVSYLEVQAVTNPGPFMSLLGKVLPMQVVGEGEDGAIVTEIVIRGISANR